MSEEGYLKTKSYPTPVSAEETFTSISEKVTWTNYVRKRIKNVFDGHTWVTYSNLANILHENSLRTKRANTDTVSLG
jgi:hypothetical protein